MNRKTTFRLMLVAFATFGLNLRADSGAGRQEAAGSRNLPYIVFVQTPKMSSATGVERFPEGSRLVVFQPNSKQSAPRVLTEGFFAAADPQVDFSGKRVLFAGQKVRGERWQIWEINLDGSSARQITKCEMDCVRPAYLPGDEIAFTKTGAASTHRQSSLESIGLDGSNKHGITFGPGDFWLETVLRDGRIVASANTPLVDSAPANANRLLYTLRPDGSGLDSLRCEHDGKAQRGEASELEDGAIIFTNNTGALMVLKHGAIHEVRAGTPGNSYRSPGPLQGDSIVVARKPAAGQRYELASISRDGSGATRTLYSDPKFDIVQPVAVAERPVPKKFWSTLIPSSQSGYFISLDSSNSIDKAQSAGPIRRVRVIEQQSSGQTVLGEAAVESDGSFYVQVPANQALRFVLLDEQGKVIREEQSWIWTRPGEQRGCTGCHGDKALAPENRWPIVLRKQEPPTRLTGKPNDTQTVESHGN